jgi:Holliday junction resolvasome RuvABC DNA-binding subunit
MYPGVDAARVRKLLHTTPGKAIVGLHMVMSMGKGHSEFADLESFTRPCIYEALQKLGYKEREIHAAMHVAQGVVMLPRS